MAALRLLLPILIGLMPGVSSARDTLGVYAGWAAFRDGGGARCYAIAAPVRPAGAPRTDAFAAVGSWPGRGIRSQFSVRLSKPLAPGVRPSLSLGDRRFALRGAGREAWAPDPRTGRAIIASLRGATSMSVSGVAINGAPFADSYALRGAPSAIDAAALGCAGVRAR